MSNEQGHHWLKPWEDGGGWWFYGSAILLGAIGPATFLTVWLVWG